MLHSSSVGFDVAAEAETVAAMLDLVSSGIGCCVLPERIAAAQLADHGLRKLPILRPMLSRRIVGIVRNDVPTAPAAQAMLELAPGELH
jgi:DNA-binding transcriptional LysR family regulator